jgi:hypothetical protein
VLGILYLIRYIPGTEVLTDPVASILLVKSPSVLLEAATPTRVSNDELPNSNVLLLTFEKTDPTENAIRRFSMYSGTI